MAPELEARAAAVDEKGRKVQITLADLATQLDILSKDKQGSVPLEMMDDTNSTVIKIRTAAERFISK